MRPEFWPRAALSLAVAALVVAALVAIGGPGAGRKEKRDEARVQDLLAMGDAIACLAADAEGKLPETLEGIESCGSSLQLDDPFTGVPYRYERLSEDRFRLCAGFEAPGRLEDSYYGRIELSEIRLDRKTGCLLFEYRW